MLPELSEIRDRRKQLNLTQLQLAELSGVSQSLIAKIESGQAIPSFENAKKLFNALEKTSEAHRVTASHLMKPKVICLCARDTAQKAIRFMEKNGFSQLPVLAEGRIIGMVSEKGLLQKIEQGWSREKLSKTPLLELTETGAPQIPPETPFRTVASLLEHAPVVLVTQKGQIKGIISKSDLLKSVLDKKITRNSRLL